jgi:branched-chain amino acid transport system permease protein
VTLFIQQLVTGLSVGSVYALMAVGYALIYSLLNFTNFAHGITVTIGAFTTFYFLTYAFRNLYAAILTGIIAGAVLAAFIEIASYRPLLKKKTNRVFLMIMGLGISVLGDNLVIIFFSGRFRIYPVNFSSEAISFFGVSIGQVDVIIFVLSILILFSVTLFITRTRTGLAIRCAAFNLDITALMGVNTMKLILVSFLLAGSLAGTAGAMLGAKYTAYPTLGTFMTNKAFICSVVGGLGSLPGSVLGAMILGISETLVSGYISSSLRDLFSYFILIVILLVRPSGLLGKNSEDKA